MLRKLALGEKLNDLQLANGYKSTKISTCRKYSKDHLLNRKNYAYNFFYEFDLVRQTKVSTWLVCGNISYGINVVIE